MIGSKGASIDVVSDKLTGNTAGILMKKATHKQFIDKYKSVTMENVVKAVLADDLSVAHTDPNISSTGLNIMIQELYAFDSANPFSDTAREQMRKFADKVPPVSPTTAEMVQVASKGLADAIISEYQSWKSDPTLKDWVFTPVGIRHDSPLYATGSLSADQLKILAEFAEFCSTESAQKEATRLGFNPTDGYIGAENKLSGAELYTALDFWKQNKDAGRAVLSVFVVDCSGSMDGEPLNQVKASLMNGVRYINEGYYVGLVSYSSSNDLVIDVPIDKFTSKHCSLFYGATKSLSSRNSTATNSALVVAMDMLVKKQTELGLNDAKLRIILLSDGAQNAGLSMSQVRGMINGLNIPVYTIGYNGNFGSLKELSEMNEAYNIDASSDDVIMKIKELFTVIL
jgi:Ca-activated chloride channel family protein